METVQDHAIHGLATIRLAGAPEQVMHAVVEGFGASQGMAGSPPDVSVSFVQRIQTDGPLRYLGLSEAAFDSSSFYLLDRAGAKSRIDFDRLGSPCEIVCEKAVQAVPLLLPIIGLCLLQKGYVLLHSSAFVYGGKGVAVAAWRKGGKSELLLPFMAAGAHFLADDWTIVSRDARLFGLPGPVMMGAWHLHHLPVYWDRLERGHRRRARLVAWYQRLYRRLPKAIRSLLRPRSILEPLARSGGEMSLVPLASAPERVFPGHVWQGPARLDVLLFGSSAEGQTEAVPIAPREVAERMIASLAFERRHFLEAYDQFLFAFPHRRNDHLETARDRELSLLSEAFTGVPAYEIRHPYPVPLGELFEVARPLIVP